MKKKLLSMAALLLVPVLLVVSLSSCTIITGNEDGPETLPEGISFNSYSKIRYDVDTPDTSDTSPVRMLRSIVSISAKSGDDEIESRGSGVVYQTNKAAGDAYIITNYHVVYNPYTDDIMPSIDVMLYGLEKDDYKIRATFVGGSAQYDIAVLKIDDSSILRASSIAEAPFADSETVKVFDNVYIVGNALGEGISVTGGNVSVDSEYITLSITNSISGNFRVIRTDAAINGGNSGGGLFNEKGEIIGIANAKLQSSSIDNVGYAIPSNLATAVADNIIYFCDGTDLDAVYKCTFGIHVETAELSSVYDEISGTYVKEEVVRVVSVDDRLDAMLKEVKEGDIVKSITIDGKTINVTKRYQLVEAMLNVREDSFITVTFSRGGGYTYKVKTKISRDMILRFE